MSENITIQEGGIAKNLNAIKKIETNVQGGGTCLWIPEDEIELGTKTITKNGLYKAKNSGVDGWTQVFVNVPGGESKTDNDGDITDENGNKVKVDSNGNPTDDSSGTPVKPKPSTNGGDGTGVTGTNGVSGINPNDGNEYHVTKDPNTGELTFTKIPSSIRVTKEPDKTSYANGETINTAGIVVHGYFKDGTDYGTIQNSELRFEPLVAQPRGSSGLFERCSVLNAGETIFLRHGMPAYGENPDAVANQTNPNTDPQYLCIVYERGVGYYMGTFSSEPGLVWCGTPSDYDQNVYNMALVNGVYVYYDTSRIGETDSYFNNYYPVINKSTIDYFLAGGSTEITVKWNRPTDQKELTTSFPINVTSSTSNNSNNGQEGGSESSGGGGSHGF